VARCVGELGPQAAAAAEADRLHHQWGSCLAAALADSLPGPAGAGDAEELGGVLTQLLEGWSGLQRQLDAAGLEAGSERRAWVDASAFEWLDCMARAHEALGQGEEHLQVWWVAGRVAWGGCWCLGAKPTPPGAPPPPPPPAHLPTCPCPHPSPQVLRRMLDVCARVAPGSDMQLFQLVKYLSLSQQAAARAAAGEGSGSQAAAAAAGRAAEAMQLCRRWLAVRYGPLPDGEAEQLLGCAAQALSMVAV